MASSRIRGSLVNMIRWTRSQCGLYGLRYPARCCRCDDLWLAPDTKRRNRQRTTPQTSAEQSRKLPSWHPRILDGNSREATSWSVSSLDARTPCSRWARWVRSRWKAPGSGRAAPTGGRALRPKFASGSWATGKPLAPDEGRPHIWLSRRGVSNAGGVRKERTP